MRDHATPRARPALRPRGHPRPDRRPSAARSCRSRRRSSPTGAGADRLRERLASVRLLLSGSAPLAQSRRGVRGAHRPDRPPGLRPHRAAPVVTSTLCSDGDGGGDRLQPGSVGGALPGSSSGWLTRPVAPRGRGPRPDPAARTQPVSAATGPTPPRDPAPRAGGRPGDVGFLDATVTCSWSTGSRSWSSSPASTSTPSRSRTRSARWRRRRGGGHRRGRRRDRGSGRGLRRLPDRAPTATRWPRRCAPTARRGSRGSSSRAASRSSTPCRSESPARCRRAAARHGAAAGRGAARVSEPSGRQPAAQAVSQRARVTLYSKPAAATCATTPRGRRARVCAELGERFEEHSILDDPGAARALPRGDPGDPRRRPPARLLAGRRQRLRAALTADPPHPTAR